MSRVCHKPASFFILYRVIEAGSRDYKSAISCSAIGSCDLHSSNHVHMHLGVQIFLQCIFSGVARLHNLHS